jgi:hypothetical protein
MEDERMGKTWVIRVNRLRLHGKRVCRFLPNGKGTFYLQYLDREFELLFRWRAGICVVAVWKRGERLARPTEPRIEWEFPSMAIKKREVQKTDVQHLASVECDLFAQHMALVEHCALRKYDDGTDREPGWFTVKVTGAAWVVQVKDPDSCTSFAAVADTLDKALDTANLLLACDEAPWEHDPWLAKTKAEKSRKK